MSKVKIQGNASGTGVVTLTAPNTNTDRTITLPDDTQTLIGTNASGNVGIGAAPAYLLDVHSTATSGTTVTANLSNAKYGVTTGYTALQIGTQYDDGSSRIVSRNNTGNQSEITLQPHAGTAGVWTDALTLTSDGRGLSQFTAKAWVNFNGTGTVAIRDSHNVSSITDLGTGHYQVNFANAMANTGYATPNSFSRAVAVNEFINIYPAGTTTTFFRMEKFSNGVTADSDSLTIVVFGD